MVHQYKSNGYNIVLDVCSGSVHVVDDLVYDIIANYENHTKEQVIELLPSFFMSFDHLFCKDIILI